MRADAIPIKSEYRLDVEAFDRVQYQAGHRIWAPVNVGIVRQVGGIHQHDIGLGNAQFGARTPQFLTPNLRLVLEVACARKHWINTVHFQKDKVVM